MVHSTLNFSKRINAPSNERLATSISLNDAGERFESLCMILFANSNVSFDTTDLIKLILTPRAFMTTRYRRATLELKITMSSPSTR